MNENEQQTLRDLQLPTMSLVEKFCETPDEVKVFFAEMMAIYEENPTPENAQRIADKIKSRESRADKQAWLKQELSSVSADAKSQASEKYIKQKNSVPQGMPTSGELLSYLDYVPRAVKDELLNAQAAGRILAHIMAPNQNLKATIIAQDVNGAPKEAKDFLNKPFSTPIQRAEQTADFLASFAYHQAEIEASKRHDASLAPKEDKNVSIEAALQECQKFALQTISATAQKLAATHPNAAQRLNNLADSYGENTSGTVNFALIAQAATYGAKTAAAYYGAKITSPNLPVQKTELSFTPQETEILLETIKKRNFQIQAANLNSLAKDSRSI